ncbi:hypothetical protein F4802DRAFT_178802 [Xylaria palmicola]|nr:hypothetical protein F4802DRAFT_178802 [Xylaria palmicola]
MFSRLYAGALALPWLQRRLSQYLICDSAHQELSYLGPIDHVSHANTVLGPLLRLDGGWVLACRHIQVAGNSSSEHRPLGGPARAGQQTTLPSDH